MHSVFRLVFLLGLAAGIFLIAGCSSAKPGLVVRQAKPVCKILPAPSDKATPQFGPGFGRLLPKRADMTKLERTHDEPSSGTSVAK